MLAQAEDDFDHGRYADALARLDEGPLPADSAGLVALRRAEMAVALGDAARARDALHGDAIKATTNRIILNRAAEAAERTEDYAFAADLWLRASKQPTWRAEKIKAIRAAAAVLARSGETSKAVDLLQTQIENDGGSVPPDVVSDLRALDGLTAFHVGLIAQARGDVAEAIAAYRQYLATNPTGPYAAAARRRLQAGPTAADTAWTEARKTATADVYRAWREAYPADPRVPEARFQEGLAHYKAGEIQAAADAWTAAAAPEAGLENRARALFWAGRALGQIGQEESARELLGTAAAIRPSNYYTVRAADRLAGQVGWPAGGTSLPDSRPSADEIAEAERWIDGWSPATDPTAADEASLRRASLFGTVGLPRTAGSELDGLIESSPNPRTVLRAGLIAVDHSLWLSAARAGLRLARTSPAKTSIDTPAAVRRLAFPPGYAETVAAESGRFGLGPLLMLSLIRQESLFDRYALSIADARGLTQVMPATGTEIAQSVGRADFTPDNLYEPSLSISFGAKYLSVQMTAFGGDVFRAVAAYNAGGGAARRWLPGVDDPDLFVESIAYAETREYVKSVYVHHAAYRGLVGIGPMR